MNRGKLVFSGVLLAAVVACGVYLAGWLVVWMLGLQRVPIGWDTWWQYFQARELPRFAPFAQKIELAGALGLGLPLLAWLVLQVPMFRAGAPSLHGDASFAGLADIRQAGLLEKTPRGILIGKWRGRPLWLNGPQHLIMIAPTRSGKTTSVAIPVLLTYEESMVVLDLKGELRKATSGKRRAMGQRIHVWAPFDEQGRTHRFNPFTLLAGSDARTRLGEIQTIAAILYPDEAGKDPFWCTQARAAFTAFASFMFETWDRTWRMGLPSDPNLVESFPSLERILRLSSGMDGQGTKDALQTILKEPGYAFIGTQTRTVFTNLSGLAEQTFSSVMATMQAPLQQFLNPILAAATNATDFDIRSIRKHPTTLYVDIPTHKLDESGKLLNIFFSSVIGNNLTKQLGEEPELKYQMLMLMDEFTAMGRVDVWAKRISISAGYGVRDLCIVQSRAQLRGTYGDNDAQNFITNHGAQIVFTPREQSDANEYSEMLGYKTLRKESRSRSSGGGGGQVSVSHSEEKRALMLPQEIKELPSDEELVFYEGCKPIRAQKNWFFKDKALKQWSEMAPVRIDPVPQASSQRIFAVELREGSPDAEQRLHGRESREIHEEPDPDQRMSIEAEGARPSSSIADHRAAPDPLYDLDLKRQFELANGQTVREHGPPPSGAMPLQVKRRPVLPVHAARAQERNEEEHCKEDEQMNFKKMAATAALAATALAGCGQQAKDYKKVRYEHNPDPRERYEITVTVQGAPGPMDFAEGGAWYDIANRTCLPRKDPYTGADVVPGGDVILLKLRAAGPGTWTTTVYADGMREAAYFGTEACTWKFCGVGTKIKATGAHEETGFKPSISADQILREETVVTYFNKRNYPRAPEEDMENFPYFGQTERTRFGPAITDADLFTITLRARKVAS